MRLGLAHDEALAFIGGDSDLATIGTRTFADTPLVAAGQIVTDMIRLSYSGKDQQIHNIDRDMGSRASAVPGGPDEYGRSFTRASIDGNPPIGAHVSAPADAGAVPEPVRWAQMLAGFGAMGSAMRLRGRRASPDRTSFDPDYGPF